MSCLQEEYMNVEVWRNNVGPSNRIALWHEQQFLQSVSVFKQNPTISYIRTILNMQWDVRTELFYHLRLRAKTFIWTTNAGASRGYRALPPPSHIIPLDESQVYGLWGTNGPPKEQREYIQEFFRRREWASE